MVGAAWLLGAALLALGAPPAQKPNLLFLQCDELAGRVLDPTHPLSKVTKMPHLEALAARGVNFIRAYTVNPLCAPSRASTFTGRYASSIRAFSNVKSLTATIGSPDEPDPICADIIGCKCRSFASSPEASKKRLHRWAGVVRGAGAALERLGHGHDQHRPRGGRLPRPPLR